MWRRLILGLAVTATLTAGTVGCGDDADTQTELPNPASVFCEEQGGTVDIVDEEGGQRGYCVLPDGTRVDEWDYYREQGPGATGS